jgi:hypothetical protein
MGGGRWLRAEYGRRDSGDRRREEEDMKSE